MKPNKASMNSVVIARAVIDSATISEQQMLLTWMQGLLEIRSGNLSIQKKAAAAISLTRESRALRPLIKVLSRELKRVGWDDRSWKSRLGLSAALLTLSTVGSAGAGIASLGGAIGVPLWVVLAGGGTLAGTFVDELKKKFTPPLSTYSVIEVSKTELSSNIDKNNMNDSSLS